MKLDEALNLLKQVCTGFRGTLQEHQTLQQALHTIENGINSKKEKDVPKTEKKEQK